jgi:glycosyltransferase involved in cell wall biosynthesis
MKTDSPLPLSIFVIAFQEADRIGRTLAAVKQLADDVVVVDSGSTDGTQTIAERHGARVIANGWPGYGPQKRFAEDQCRYDWVLNLDADEVATPELIAEIRKIFASEPMCSGYRFRTVTVYPGQTKPRWLADSHNFIRLYNRKHMRFSDSLTDDEVQPGQHSVAKLSGTALHFSFRKLEDIAPKLLKYARLQTHEKAKAKSVLAMQFRYYITEFPMQFLKYYIGRRHLTGGWTGLRYAATLAYSKRTRLQIFIAFAQSGGNDQT